MNISTVKVGNIDIAYRWDGNANGPVVMMAHAMGTSHRLFDSQVAALGDRFHVLRYDWRGHGDTSAPPGPYTLGQFVADALGTMDALGLDAVHWVGISTGGMIGQGLGIHHGERLASLTLCNTNSEADEWYRAWVAERQAVVRREGMPAVWEMTKRLWFTDAFVDAAGPDYEAVRQVFVRTPITGYLGGTSAVTDLGYQGQLHRITTPTRVIAAGADPVTPVEKSQAIAQRIGDAQLTVLDGLRHFSNVEAPAAFNAALREGLDAMTRE